MKKNHPIFLLFQSYPEELQTRGDHFENPLAPYETVITYEDLSDEAKKFWKRMGLNHKATPKKN